MLEVRTAGIAGSPAIKMWDNLRSSRLALELELMAANQSKAQSQKAKIP
jgi:hypothetical protein